VPTRIRSRLLISFCEDTRSGSHQTSVQRTHFRATTERATLCRFEWPVEEPIPGADWTSPDLKCGTSNGMTAIAFSVEGDEMRSIITVAAGLLSVVSVGAAPATFVLDGPSEKLTIGIYFNGSANLGERVIETAMGEAEALWMRHHVVLARASQADACIDVTISDVPITGTLRTAWALPLGGIDFSVDGVPDRHVNVSRRSIEDLMDYPGSPLHAHSHPRVLHDLVIGRILGRIVAHEVGHFVLRFPAHVPAGLMASQHTAAEFASVYRQPFELNVILEGRLREVFRTKLDPCATH